MPTSTPDPRSRGSSDRALACLAVGEMPVISGLKVPHEFYTVRTHPAFLAGMCYPPSGTPWQTLHVMGFRRVVCLCSENPTYDPAPLGRLWADRLDDLAGGSVPTDPGRDERLIREAVGISVEKLRSGEGVVVHCVGGTGRTGTVIGAILRVLGTPSAEVVDYL